VAVETKLDLMGLLIVEMGDMFNNILCFFFQQNTISFGMAIESDPDEILIQSNSEVLLGGILGFTPVTITGRA
jgi:hypothetical protein